MLRHVTQETNGEKRKQSEQTEKIGKTRKTPDRLLNLYDGVHFAMMYAEKPEKNEKREFARKTELFFVPLGCLVTKSRRCFWIWPII